jgi:hypothetical protein
MAELVRYMSIKGRLIPFPAVQVGPEAVAIIRADGLLKTAEVHDEFWLKASEVPDPETTIEVLRRNGHRPDLFTFAQRFPDVERRYSYDTEWDNIAVASFESYSDWFENKIDRHSRKHIRKAAREGVETVVVPFTDDFVRGISEIYNESPVRQGKPFWHYAKAFAAVRDENITYAERSTFVGAFFGDELIGYAKFVADGEVAHFMQIVSKMAHFDKCPTNALLSKAIEACAEKGIHFLSYGEYDAGKRARSTLAEFKRNNGFERVDIPRYYVPLTPKGRIALGLGLHKGIQQLIPTAVLSRMVALRDKWYVPAKRVPTAAAGARSG